MKKPKSILSNLPTCNISSDFDHCLPFILFPQPPLGLANHGWDVGARLGVGHSSERERERERERRKGREKEVEGTCQTPGSAVDGNSQPHLKGGFPLAAPCGLLVHPRQTSNPTLDLAHMGQKKKKRERTKFAPFFKKWTQGSQAVFHSSWSFSFLNKPPGF